jgi:hypothetical protein
MHFSTEQMRNRLQPLGTADIVMMGLDEQFFNKEFIHSCIDELDGLVIRSSLGHPVTNL